MNIYEKLANARSDFKKLNLKMSGDNKFVGYKYFDLSDILPATTELEKKYKMISIVSFGLDTAALTIIDAEKPEDRIIFQSPMSTAELKGCHPVQNLGAVESYVRRYLYLTAYEVVESDQLDLTQGKDPVKATAAPQENHKDAAPTNNQSTQYSSDLTLEQAGKLSFKNGKNANIPFSELTDETLQWVVEKMNGSYQKAAKMILDSRCAEADPEDLTELPFVGLEDPTTNNLPF